MERIEVYIKLRENMEKVGVTQGTLYFPEEKAVTSITNFNTAFKDEYQIKVLPETPEFEGKKGIRFNKLEQGVQK